MRIRGFRDDPCYERRALLGLVLTPFLVGAARADDDARMPPQPDDRFVFLTGPKKGQVVRIEDLPLGGPQVQAYPVDPDGTVRNETPLNLVILARFDPTRLAEETRARAADGVVAYSGVCTHQGCPVNICGPSTARHFSVPATVPSTIL
jgi:rieske iron-sulfur protein